MHIPNSTFVQSIFCVCEADFQSEILKFLVLSAHRLLHYWKEYIIILTRRNCNCIYFYVPLLEISNTSLWLAGREMALIDGFDITSSLEMADFETRAALIAVLNECH